MSKDTRHDHNKPGLLRVAQERRPETGCTSRQHFVQPLGTFCNCLQVGFASCLASLFQKGVSRDARRLQLYAEMKTAYKTAYRLYGC